MILTLADIKQNKTYLINKLNTSDNILKERFIALGICDGTSVRLLEHSIDRATIAIMANNTRIALRMSEAREVGVMELV